MDKKFTHILLYIYKHPYISYNCLQSKFNRTYNLENMIEQLSFDNMISFRIAESPKSDEGYEVLHVEQSTHLLCTSKGNEYIENKLDNNRRWNITTAIALFASIGAYRQELVYILQAIMTLLKSIMEN